MQAPLFFLSDLHLSEQTPTAVDCFLSFLTGEARSAQAIYILGDFMDYWVGDDEQLPLHKIVLTALKQLTISGVPVYIMPGNRDFLLGPRFFDQSGALYLPDPSVIKVFGQMVLLSHGDALCTSDVRYLRYRHWVRKAWFQKFFLRLPLAWRCRVAQRIRQKSAAYQSNRLPIDVSEAAVQQACQKHHCAILIHGHTHRLAIHYRDGYQRWVLGDWHAQGNVLCITPERWVFQICH